MQALPHQRADRVPSDEQVLLLFDILPTNSWASVEAGLSPSLSVPVFGAGQTQTRAHSFMPELLEHMGHGRMQAEAIVSHRIRLADAARGVTAVVPCIPGLVPHVRLFGHVDGGMLGEFFRQQQQAPRDEPVVFELSTLGGDPDIGRRLAQEIRLWREHAGVDVYFLGKTFVYSAGVTVMSAFPVNRRFLTEDTVLLIHERKITKTIELNGALRACKALVDDVLAQLESGQRVEERDFARLVQGSHLSAADLRERVLSRDWYVAAAEALRHGLVAGLIDDSGAAMPLPGAGASLAPPSGSSSA